MEKGTRSRRTLAYDEAALVVCAALGSGALAVPELAAWPPTPAALAFCALTLVNVAVAALTKSALSAPSSRHDDWTTVRPAFVVDFAVLLLLGPRAGVIASTAGAIVRLLRESPGGLRPVETLLPAAASPLALGAAAFTHLLLGGTIGTFEWPWQGAPIAAAVCAYCLVLSAVSELAVPLLASRPPAGSWPRVVLAGCPSYLTAAALAVVVVELIERRLWTVAVVASVPVFIIYRSYADHVGRREQESRRQEALASLDHGVSMIDDTGIVTLWNHALQRLLGCPADRALGQPLWGVVPVLAETELPRALREAARTKKAVRLSSLGLPGPGGTRMVDVRILPGASGMTMQWRDVTATWRAESLLKRSEERFAQIADAANDGLWEWDLRRDELYASARWRALVGLGGAAGVCRPQEWLDRVHAHDIGSLKAALDAHLSGATDSFQHEHRIRVEGTTYRLFHCRAVAVRGPNQRPIRLAGSLTDVTERALVQEQLRSVGTHDPLTGLCNRAVFVEQLGRRLQDLKARHGSRFATLYLDLDRFKVVNDSLGHMVGDQLLTAVSRRLETCLRPGDALARLGGDEFAVLVNGLSDETQANAVALRIQDALKAPVVIGGREVFTSASIGIAFAGRDYDRPEDIMRDADTAMYHAKSRGKARHELFDADMHARVLDRLGLENDLRHAIAQHDLVVHYQPIVSLASRRCVGFESLVRWTRKGKPVPPATFIPIAEEIGLIEPLGTWVLQQACAAFADWRRRFPHSGLEYVTVNVSGRQLMQQNLPMVVEEAVRTARMQPSELRLEITETALMDSPADAARVLGELRYFGVKIYLDDFGTGFSSLSHLHKLPVDALKIDRSFVTSLLLPDRPAIVESILALARTLKTGVVAEGIEEDVQAAELERLGCTHAQGFLFSRPLPAAAVEEVLKANLPLGPAVESPEREARQVGGVRFFTPKPRPDAVAGRAPAKAASRQIGRSSSRVLPATAPDPKWPG
jgi:diguanylate cyclase (GGDEF)-like protein/PAS domain S-box-containing protein